MWTNLRALASVVIIFVILKFVLSFSIYELESVRIMNTVVEKSSRLEGFYEFKFQLFKIKKIIIRSKSKL